MELNVIDFYIRNILRKQLQKLKISNQGLYEITDNIKEQLYSIIKHWKDTAYKQALFTTVREEGEFYIPTTQNQIGNLIVLGVRNSLLETITSIDSSTYGLASPITDKQTIEITTKAIEYFKDINLEELSQTITLEIDYYDNIIKKYPIAWNALIELGKLTNEKNEREYQKIPSSKFIFDELNRDIKEIKEQNTENGITEYFNDSLIGLLQGIRDGYSNLFYVDSFKFLTRNFEKTLKVLEFILTHDAMFITNNYCITNNYVSKRKEIIRAGHGKEFNITAIQTIDEISNKYGKEILEKILGNFNNRPQ